VANEAVGWHLLSGVHQECSKLNQAIVLRPVDSTSIPNLLAFAMLEDSKFRRLLPVVPVLAPVVLGAVVVAEVPS
jgi:hypothetical protein